MARSKFILIAILLCLFQEICGATTYKDTKAKFDVKTLREAISAYAQEKNVYPNLDTWSDELIENNFIRSLPKDPWGNSYVYYFPPKYGTDAFDLYSLGKNEQDDNGLKDDISAWRDVDRNFYPREGMLSNIVGYIIFGVLISVTIGFFWKKYRKKHLTSI